MFSTLKCTKRSFHVVVVCELLYASYPKESCSELAEVKGLAIAFAPLAGQLLCLHVVIDQSCFILGKKLFQKVSGDGSFRPSEKESSLMPSSHFLKFTLKRDRR